MHNIIVANKDKNKYVIETGVGLQDVDRLKNSARFLNEADRYVKGEISLEELDDIVFSYYKSKPNEKDRTEEADKIAVRIAKIISEDSFTFTVGQLLTIHKILFDGLLEHSGEIRKYNFSKSEWVLGGDSVTYGDYRDLEMILQYDFEQERKFSYKGLSMNQVIDHLALFVANLWQIHVFEEGNTRTTAVFFIKYLRSIGFDVTNDTFAKHSWYFRNSLVRANYNNVVKGVFEDRSYLIKFLRNLLLKENNILRNRDLHIAVIARGNISREMKILNFIKENPYITADQLSSEMHVSIRTIKNILEAMKENGQIKRVNGKRYGRWMVL